MADYNMSESQILELQKAFSAVDTDADGVISTQDLRPLLRILDQNPTDADLQVSLEQNNRWLLCVTSACGGMRTDTNYQVSFNF